MSDELAIRQARPDDADALYALVAELAAYEDLADGVQAGPEDIRRALADGGVFARLAFLGDRPVGFALFFETYSSFLGRRGVYLEDIYVREEARGQGIGKALLAAVAKYTCDHCGGRLEWAVLNWNEPAIRFYQSLGASPLDAWTTYRVAGEPLEKLAATAR